MKSIFRKVSLGLGTLVLAANFTVGGLTSLSAVSIPVANVTVGGMVLTTGGLALLMAEVACSKDQLVASAKDVLSVLTDKTLISALQTLSPPFLQRIEALVPTAKDLITAIKNGDTSSALAAVNTIFPVIEEAFALFSAGNPAVLAVLALANIGLHFIINHVSASGNVPKTARRLPAMQQAAEYGTKPAWGCSYRQDNRCAALAH